MKKYLIFSSVIFLTACVSITPVTSAGKDTYMIAGNNSLDEGADGVNIVATLYGQANAHCESLQKNLVPLNESIGRKNAKLMFRCLSENDPEYVRPNLKIAPNIKIESN